MLTEFRSCNSPSSPIILLYAGILGIVFEEIRERFGGIDALGVVGEPLPEGRRHVSHGVDADGADGLAAQQAAVVLGYLLGRLENGGDVAAALRLYLRLIVIATLAGCHCAASPLVLEVRRDSTATEVDAGARRLPLRSQVPQFIKSVETRRALFSGGGAAN